MKASLLRHFAAAALIAAAIPSTAAWAQAAPAAALSEGMKVLDGQGGEVGTITAIKGDTITVKTDKHEAALQRSGFAVTDGHAVLGLTRQQLNDAIEQSQAAAQAKLVAGAGVTGSDNGPVGTIDSIDDQFVTLKLASGKLVKIPRNGIVAGPNGGVVAVTAQQLEAQAAGPAKK